MSSIEANVVDLAGSPSPLKPLRNGHRNTMNNDRRSRRSPRFRNGTDTNDDGSAKAAPEIINLADSSPSPEPPMITTRRNARRKRHRPPTMHTGMGMTDDDDDIIEITSPPVAAAAQKQQSHTSEKKRIDRIREVFPLVSRAKVEAFLAMASSYSTDESDGDAVLYTVMTVLAEVDPTGASISEASFAAASVGGCVEGGNSAMETSRAVRHGRRKVAQLECQCCFAEYDFEVMVSCRGGHLFCRTCLQKHTEQRVFGVGNLGVRPNSTEGGNAKQTSKALEILCMASDCTFGFQEGQLRKALSEKVLKKYNELQFAAVIESANMKDISKCSKCHFIAVADAALPAQLFHCPQCNFKSCKDCGEEYHPNIRCDQVETKNETDGRRTVEEAMTTAMVRTCPRPMCRKKFLKNDGCNKMTCSCGCFICYVCRKEIPASVAYQHFCQTPHCQHKECKKCPLYADTSAADKVRITNAAKKAARSARKMKINVDVDSMLKDPP